MKKILLLLIVCVAAGCTVKGEKVSTYFKDPQYVSYTEKKAMLESKYLNKEITYANYVNQLNDLEMDYQRNKQEIEQKLSD